MGSEPGRHPTYPALNRPLCVLGVERKLFFAALGLAAAVFQVNGNVLTGLLVGAGLLLLARWATAVDPKILRIMLSASRLKRVYDPLKVNAAEFGKGRHGSGNRSRGRQCRDIGALHEVLNFDFFHGEYAIVTKTGDVATVLACSGIDTECLEPQEIDRIARLVESAVKTSFGPNFRLYTHQLKFPASSIATRTGYPNAIVEQAQRSYLETFARRELYEVRTFFTVVFHPESRLKAGLGSFLRNPSEFIRERFSADRKTALLDEELEKRRNALADGVEKFVQQVEEIGLRLLRCAKAYRFLLMHLNPAPYKWEQPLTSAQFLDWHAANSHIESHPEYLRIDDFFATTLVLKETPTNTWADILGEARKIPGQWTTVTEWRRISEARARFEITLKQRHFWGKRLSAIDSLSKDPGAEKLKNQAAYAQVDDLAECLKEHECNGQFLGEFSLMIVLYARSEEELRRLESDFVRLFARYGATLVAERANRLASYLATIPGNDNLNERRMFLLSRNHADLLPIFTLDSGEPQNAHLRDSYLSVLETNDRTPYYLNLHVADNAHAIIVGQIGSGKSVGCNKVLSDAQQYNPLTFIFDLGGSYRAITQLYGGSYFRISFGEQPFTLNPFAVQPNPENIDHLIRLVIFLAEMHGFRVSATQRTEIVEAVRNMFSLDPDIRRLSTFAALVPKVIAEQLSPWIGNGQYARLFDNEQDDFTLTDFQTFDFEGMKEHRHAASAFVFLLLGRLKSRIGDPREVTRFKLCVMDEAWLFLEHEETRDYIREAFKTWRKRNGAIVLATQSSTDLTKSAIAQVAIESCPTKIFLANPEMDPDTYANLFHLNSKELELLRALRPKRQLLVKQPHRSKVLNLNLDPKSYVLFTSNPYEVKKREEAFAKYGFEQGLEILAAEGERH